MEEAFRIFEFLPLSFKDENERDYIIHLRESFEVNYAKGKYPFAFMAYHMLFMAFVYFEIWQIRVVRRADFDKGMIGYGSKEKEINRGNRPFSLSTINEASIFHLLKLLGCEEQEFGKFKKVVEERNEIAHVSGNLGFSNQQTLDLKIQEILRYAEKIQSLTNPIISESFKNFLASSFDPDTREYSTVEDEIRESLVHRHYLSMEDIRLVMRFNMDEFQDHPNFSQIQQLFDAFVSIYKED